MVSGLGLRAWGFGSFRGFKGFKGVPLNGVIRAPPKGSIRVL